MKAILPDYSLNWRHWLSVATFIVLFFVVIYVFSPILTPFFFAAIVAYICNPLVNRLQRHRVPRGVGTTVVIILVLVLITLFLLVVLPMIYDEARMLIDRLPLLLDWLKQDFTPWLRKRFGITLYLDPGHIRQSITTYWQGTQGFITPTLTYIAASSARVISFVMSLVLFPVVLFYLLRDWLKIIHHIDQMIPRRIYSYTHQIVREIDHILNEFLRGQLLVMLIMSIYYSTALWAVGLDYALPIGIVAGVLVVIPYIGALLGLVLATLGGFVQFGTLGGLLPVWAVYIVGQTLEGMVVTPAVVGKSIGLHPVVVIFALLAFGQVFGFIGILLALPISAILLVATRHIKMAYLQSQFYNHTH